MGFPRIERDGVTESKKHQMGLYTQTPSVLSAAWTLSKFAVPYTLARLAMSLTGVVNSLLLAEFGSSAVEAGPFITSIQFAVLGTVRGFLLATSILGGVRNGAGKFKEVGSVVHASWLAGFLLTCLFVAPIFIGSAAILKLCNVSSNVAEQAGEYFYGLMWGAPAFVWGIAEQQFALCTKNSKLTLMFGMVYGLLAAGCAYILALGKLGFPRCGVRGLGYGASVSAWINLFLYCAYYSLRPNLFSKYALTKCSRSKTCGHMPVFLKKGTLLGFQRSTEWLNLMLITFFSSILGNGVLAAEQVSVTVITSVGLVVLGFAQALGSYGANVLGSINSDRSSIADKKKKISHMLRMNNVGIMIGVLLSVIACAVCFIFPAYIIKAFTSKKNSSNEDIMHLAQSLLFVNGISLVGDGVRNMSAGALRGYKDVAFAPWASFILMTILGVGAGAAVCFGLHGPVIWFFIIRTIAIYVAGPLNFHRSLKLNSGLFNSRVNEPEIPSVSEDDIRTVDENRLLLGMQDSAN